LMIPVFSAQKKGGMLPVFGVRNPNEKPGSAAGLFAVSGLSLRDVFNRSQIVHHVFQVHAHIHQQTANEDASDLLPRRAGAKQLDQSAHAIVGRLPAFGKTPITTQQSQVLLNIFPESENRHMITTHQAIVPGEL